MSCASTTERGAARAGLLACGALILAACGGDNPPIIDAIPDVVAPVGDEISFVVRARDADNDGLTFSFSSEDLPDLASRQPPATIEPIGVEAAVFRWIPRVADVRDEPYPFLFTVSDGRRTTTVLTQITVRGLASGDTPSFVQPIGSGTTLDLDVQPCLDLDVEVNDNDATSVTITEDEPRIEGATLTQDGPFTAKWRWCPTADQAAKQDRAFLRLSADDGKNPRFSKTPAYLIVVISSGAGIDCPGAPPTIGHTPTAVQTTLQDLKIDFTVNDDTGLKGAPILYWSLADPGLPPVLSAMTPVAVTLTSGGGKSAGYSATIPNPVAGMPAGSEKSLYYILTARDNDDPTGGCNHVTFLPAVGAYKVKVIADGAGGVLACETCTNDVQCGGANDNCITIAGELRCATACAVGGACGPGYVCSPTVVTSVNGKVARQCFPMSGSCSIPCSGAGCPCLADAREPSDTPAQATAVGRPASPAKVSYTNLSICPANPDWYSVQLNAGDQLVVDLTFVQVDLDGDLDVHLYKPDGTTDLTPCSPAQPACRFSNGQSGTSNEHFEWTIPSGQAGTYYVVVQGYDPVDTNRYDIAVTVK